jgi:mannose-6-phosphate isomerase-like protein (cupin superfamily)
VKVVHVAEIPVLPALGGTLAWKPVRHTLGIDAFGVNAYQGDAVGDLVVEDHRDPHQELYVVLRGTARFRSGDAEFDAPAGTFVLFEPREHRVAHALEPGTVVVAIGAEAKRFEPSSWEYAFRARGHLHLGHQQAAREALADGLARYPDRYDLLYANACLQASTGDRDAALTSLRQAVAERPVVLDWARDEPLLDPIRDDPRFPS